VFLVDANVLLHAVNTDSRQHEAARAWLDAAIMGTEEVGLPYVVTLAFLRVATRPGVFSRPLTTAEACSVLAAWVTAPAVVDVAPARDHAARLCALLDASGTAGNLVPDAHLAALALERDATVVTFDRDFARFGGLRIHLLDESPRQAGP